MATAAASVDLLQLLGDIAGPSALRAAHGGAGAGRSWAVRRLTDGMGDMNGSKRCVGGDASADCEKTPRFLHGGAAGHRPPHSPGSPNAPVPDCPLRHPLAWVAPPRPRRPRSLPPPPPLSPEATAFFARAEAPGPGAAMVVNLDALEELGLVAKAAHAAATGHAGHLRHVPALRDGGLGGAPVRSRRRRGRPAARVGEVAQPAPRRLPHSLGSRDGGRLEGHRRVGGGARWPWMRARRTMPSCSRAWWRSCASWPRSWLAGGHRGARLPPRAGPVRGGSHFGDAPVHPSAPGADAVRLARRAHRLEALPPVTAPAATPGEAPLLMGFHLDLGAKGRGQLDFTGRDAVRLAFSLEGASAKDLATLESSRRRPSPSTTPPGARTRQHRRRAGRGRSAPSPRIRTLPASLKQQARPSPRTAWWTRRATGPRRASPSR